MAREIVLSIWCDLCQDLDDKKVEAEEMPPVQIGTSTKPRILALCTEHKETFFNQFQTVLMDLGVTNEVLANTQQGRTASKKKSTSSGKGTGRAHPGDESDPEALIPCPLIAECNSEVSFKSRGSLQGHMKNFHQGVSVGDALQRVGQEYLMDEQGNVAAPDSARNSGPTAPPKVQRAECDQEGCTTVYEWPKHSRPSQALSIHLAKHHGIKGQSKTQKNRQRAREEQLAQVS